jgi:hypothetical protein
LLWLSRSELFGAQILISDALFHLLENVDIIWEFEEATIINWTREFKVECSLSKQKVFGSFPLPCIMWHSVPRHVGGIPHAYFGKEDPYDVLFQQDRKPPHFHFWNHKFPEKLIVSWPPPCSPDLIPLAFFWAYIKDPVYLLPVAIVTLNLLNWSLIRIHLLDYSHCRNWISVKYRSQKHDNITYWNAFSFHSCAV